MTLKVTRRGKVRGPTKLVKITEDVRRCAAENAIDENSAIEHGMRQSLSRPGGRISVFNREAEKMSKYLFQA